MNGRHIPNVITVFRLLLVPPVAYLILQRDYTTALVLFAIAGASDGLDGFLAKRYRWTSRLGGLLDPLADKLLMVSTYLCLGWQGLIPPWLVAAVLLRDVVIVSGALAYHFRVEKVQAEPSVISKLNTVVQILLVLAVMFAHTPWTPPPSFAPALAFLVYAVLATTVLSGAHYVWTWAHRAQRVTRERKADD